MKLAQVLIASWEKLYDYTFDPALNLNVGDYVVVNTPSSIEMGKVLAFKDIEQPIETDEAVPEVLRKASKEDLDIVLSQNKEKKEAFVVCKKLIIKHNLPIKLVDVHFSFDNLRVVFAFIAEGRVDFRELLKDLNKQFKRSIRLQQLGIRDEIKMTGDIGCCGRDLCCKSHLKELASVTSDLADLQQVAHRGSDRLSGVCGRLKCCLLYEKETYDSLADNLPLMGEKIKTKHGKGEVIGWHILKQTVDVLLDDNETIVEVPIAK